MSTGCLELKRSVHSSEMWERMPYSEKKLYMWLLSNANWEDSPERDLKAGELSFSLRFIRRAVTFRTRRGGVRRPFIRTLRTHLKKMEENGFLSILLSPNDREAAHRNGVQAQIRMIIHRNGNLSPNPVAL